MIIDNHVHMGWFSDGYHSPMEIGRSLKQAGVDSAVISSTSTCADLYHNVKTEFFQLFSLFGKENILPILWLSPAMLLKGWPLKKLLKSKVEWRGIKLHYISHPLWSKVPFLVKDALDIARNLGNVPVLIHTGEWENCHAGVFKTLIAANPDLNFVLAHGRPIEETINLMKDHPNVWTDTAFMPIKDVKSLIVQGLSKRILFGSDTPIVKVYYPNISITDYLQQRIKEIMKIDSSIMSNNLYF